jgi:phage host-nuclease inhibitor protein Gam
VGCRYDRELSREQLADRITELESEKLTLALEAQDDLDQAVAAALAQAQEVKKEAYVAAEAWSEKVREELTSPHATAAVRRGFVCTRTPPAVSTHSKQSLSTTMLTYWQGTQHPPIRLGLAWR